MFRAGKGYATTEFFGKFSIQTEDKEQIFQSAEPTIGLECN